MTNKFFKICAFCKLKQPNNNKTARLICDESSTVFPAPIKNAYHLNPDDYSQAKCWKIRYDFDYKTYTKTLIRHCGHGYIMSVGENVLLTDKELNKEFGFRIPVIFTKKCQNALIFK